MSAKTIDYKVVLRRDGQTQSKRMPELLDPDRVPVDSRNKEEYYRYLQAISAFVKFYDVDAQGKVLESAGNWQPFFSDTLETLKAQSEAAALPPHLALWNAFIELYEHPKALMNKLTRRHLDFYYKEVLKLKNRASVADRVHVLFELKKNTKNTLIEAGTLLLAGKDTLKKDLIYKLEHNLIVNPSKVMQLRSVYVNPANNNFIHHAPVANSIDGLGGMLDPEHPGWEGFGSADTPLAEIGFCLAGDVLSMKEGIRIITAEFTLNHFSINPDNPALSAKLFKVSVTGEKGWIGPKVITPVFTQVEGSTYRMLLTIELGKDEPAVTAYNVDTHGKGFDTSSPMLKCILNNEKIDFGYADFMQAELADATLSVEVKEISGLELENDFGSINPKKPFKPFGPNGEENANFYIQHEETFSKRLKEFSLDVEWKNIPESNLANYFKNYGARTANSNSDFQAIASFKDGYAWQESYRRVNLFNSYNAQSKVNWRFISPRFPELQPYLIMPNVQFVYNLQPGQSLQQAVSSRLSYLVPGFSQLQTKTILTGLNSIYSAHSFVPVLNLMLNVYKEIRKGSLALRLDHGFLFKDYRTRYASEMLRYSREGGTLNLPSEPFSPEIQSISLSYKATTAKITFSGTALNDFIGQELEFFQIAAFGPRREHAYIRSKHSFLSNQLIKLVPENDVEGRLLIGLSNLSAGDTASLLIQVVEGSADPELSKAAPQWSVLCDNYWQPLTPDDIIMDTTNGCLQSGIVRLLIPKQATTTNTMLPEGLIWLQAAIQKDTDAVCKIVDILPNAATAIFEDHENEASHLATALPPKSINKLTADRATILSVKQPFSSFGGALQESDLSYYTRISERLRHKERAVAIWDYERLVLQHFPGIHKVKCINHADKNSFYAPGKTLIVVVPDLSNRNAVDPFKPKTDKNTLEQIAAFLTSHASPWASFQVVSPSYEPVQVMVNLKLKKGYEFNYYRQVIDQKLKAFLSPWINNPEAEINFGGKVTKSMIIKLLEDLEYIDYLSSLNLIKLGPFRRAVRTHVDFVEASSPASILVSHTNHIISND